MQRIRIKKDTPHAVSKIAGGREFNVELNPQGDWNIPENLWHELDDTYLIQGIEFDIIEEVEPEKMETTTTENQFLVQVHVDGLVELHQVLDALPESMLAEAVVTQQNN